MKKLQLMKHITGELVKGNRMVKGKIDGMRVAYTDGYTLWIIKEKDDIFSDNISSIDIDTILHEDEINNLKIIENHIIIGGTSTIDKNLARGVIDGIPFYFNIDYLKYFDKNCKLYKYNNDPLTPIFIKDKNDTLEGMIMPVHLDDTTKKELDKKLGL